MKIYDISMPIHPDIQVWKDNPEKKPKFTIMRDYDQAGKGNRETRVALDMHTGTHIDAPLHFIADGAPIEETTLEQLVRTVKVLDLTAIEDHISAEDLRQFEIAADDFLLLKTRNSSVADEFDFNFVYLDHTGAQYLIEKGIAGVGADAVGIERAQADHPTHIGLLSNDIIIIEGLRLAQIAAGEYFMVAAPLKMVGVEAAPARIFLLDHQI